ncbi:hypothetical protein Pla163_10790 [Planctomycetes bacterium Pla163]|uniref:CARDB domain-containing protein n=1 Tax=Rohdeia mirabilis TaxID=2528008 RepID=A0A518CXP0_9BACT|nr:hypothetical protein Pla163_10790 [Planctomycetes bacterium Pla163]
MPLDSRLAAVLGACFAFLVLFAAPASAVQQTTATWLGTQSTDWHTPANWSTGQVPTLGEHVVVPDQATVANSPRISSQDAVANAVDLRQGARLTMDSARTLLVRSWKQVDAASSPTSGWVRFGGGGTVEGAEVELSQVRLASGAVELMDDLSIRTRLEVENGSTSGSGAVVFEGGSAYWEQAATSTGMVHRVRLEGTAGNQYRYVQGNPRVGELEQVGGRLHFADGVAQTLTVTGAFTVSGGLVEMNTHAHRLDVEGDVVVSGGQLSGSSATGALTFGGTWSATADFLVSGGPMVVAGGGAVIDAQGHRIDRLKFEDGLVAVDSDVRVIGLLAVENGSTNGPGAIVMDSGGSSYWQQSAGGTGELGRVRLEGTAGNQYRYVQGDSRVGELEQVGGRLHFADGVAQTLTVTGAFTVSGGLVEMNTHAHRLDVEGDVVVSGGQLSGSSATGALTFGGTWSATADFLVSGGPMVVAGGGAVIDAQGHRIDRLRFEDGLVAVDSDVSVIGLLAVENGSTNGPGSIVLDSSATSYWQQSAGGIGEVGRVRLEGPAGNQYRYVQGDPRVGELEQVGGRLNFADGVAQTLTVTGTFTVSGGQVEMNTHAHRLDVAGDVVVSGGQLSGSGAASLLFGGTWTSTVDFSVGAVYVIPRDGAVLDAQGTAVGRIKLASGEVEIESDVQVSDRLLVEAGKSSGDGAFVFNAPSTGTDYLEFAEGATGHVHAVRVESGYARFQGPVRIEGTLDLSGGELEFYSSGGATPQNIVVEGDVLANGARIGNSSPEDYLSFSGTWVSTADTTVSGSGWVRPLDGAHIDAGGLEIERLLLDDGAIVLDSDHRAANRVKLVDATTSGPGAIVFDAGASGRDYLEFADSATGHLHAVRIDSGYARFQGPVRIEGTLDLSGGELEFYSSGGATPQDIVVDGDVLANGARIGNSSPEDYLSFSGTWVSTADTTVSGSGWVRPLDGAHIDAGGLEIERLLLDDGAIVLDSDHRAANRVKLVDATTSGPGAIVFDAGASGRDYLEFADSATGHLHAVRIDSGYARFQGPVRIEGTLDLSGGELEFYSTGGSTPQDIVVEGDVLANGGRIGNSSPEDYLSFSGAWVSTGESTVSGAGWIRPLDGAVIDAASFGVQRVAVTDGEVTSVTPLVVDGTLRIDDGALLSVSSSLELGTTFDVAGALEIGPGAALRLPSNFNRTLASTGRLALLGTPLAPAVLESSNAPGYRLTIDGEFAAVNFVVRDMNSQGLVLSSSARIGAEGVVAGSFERGAQSPGSRILRLELPLTGLPNELFAGVDFEGDANSSDKSVSRPSNALGEAVFVTFGGTLGGEAFEDDPAQSAQDPDGLVRWESLLHPDVAALVIGAAEVGVVNEPTAASYVAQNRGGVDAVGPWVDRVWLSVDANLDGNDPLWFEETVSAPVLAGETYTFSGERPLPDGLNGDYWVFVQLDAEDALDENGIESNNTLISATRIQIDPFPRPDLIVTDVQAPIAGTDGEPVLIGWTVKNRGTEDVTAAWEDRLYLSRNGFLDGSDVLLGTAPYVGTLLEGDSLSRSAPFVVPAGLYGTYQVIVRTDAVNQVTNESRENNNVLADEDPLEITQPELPDLRGVAANVAPADPLVVTDLFPGTAARVSWAVQNFDANQDGKGTANPAAGGQWRYRFYLSDDPVQDGTDQTLAYAYGSATLDPGATDAGDFEFTLPAQVGTYWLIGVADDTSMLPESDEANNAWTASFDVLDPTYEATVATTFVEGAATDAPGELVVMLVGQALDTNVDPPVPVPNVPVTVRVRQGASRRVLDATTDGNGDYFVEFEPFVKETGRFLLYADHPAVLEDPAQPQDQFDLFDLRVTPLVRSESLVAGQSVTRTITLRNPSSLPVGGITTDVAGVPAHLVVQNLQVPAALAPYQSVTVSYDLAAIALPAAGEDPASVELRFQLPIAGFDTRVETHTAIVSVGEATPFLVATPSALNVEAPRGVSTQVIIDVRNTGLATATNVTVADPVVLGSVEPYTALDMVAQVSSPNLGDIAPGESKKVTLAIAPGPDEPFATFSGGTIVVQSAEPGVGFVLPLQFQVIGTGAGVVRVRAEDEATYYGLDGLAIAQPGPGLEGATVRLTTPADPQFVLEAITGVSGEVEFGDVPEGAYLVRVTAPDHSPREFVIAVNNSQALEATAFLPIQAVTYSFSVEEVEITAETVVTITATFQTEVPVPQIKVTPNSLDFRELALGESKVFYVNIANDGIIAAQGMELFMPDLPAFDIDVTQEVIGDFAAGASTVVQVTVTRTSDDCALAADTSVTWGLRHYLLLGDQPLWYWTPIYYAVDGCQGQSVQPSPSTPPPSLPPPSIGGGGGGGTGGSSGGGGGGGFGAPGTPVASPPPAPVAEVGCDVQ